MTNKNIALILALLVCIITFSTLDDYGITWDEGEFYFSASQSYYTWFRKPRLSTIDEYWSANPEQPPLVKILAGHSWYLFHKKLGFKNIISFRIFILIFVFILFYSLFRFSAELLNKWIAFLISVMFFMLPRVFFHSHLAAMDYPLTALWFFCIYAYWRGSRDGKWMIYSAIALGFALATKISAFFIYVPIFFYWLLCENKKKLFIKSIPLLIVPPIMFFVLWPWLWKDPIHRIWEYLSFHKDHAFLPTYYLGKVYKNAPWHYPYVLTFFTVPIAILVPFFVGIFGVFSKTFRKEKIIILFSALLPIVILSFPSIPRYDGIRLFLPAFPFMCIVSGIGVKLILDKIKYKKIFLWCYIVLLITSLYNGIVRYYPYNVAYYNEIAGGINGALKKGMEMDYWGSSYKGLLDWLNAQGRCNIFVFEDPYPFEWYKEDGLLSNDIALQRYGDSKYMLLLIRQGMFNEETWDYFKNREPVYSVRVLGMPLTCVYKINEERREIWP